MRLFEGTLHFARTGSGDVNALHGDMAGAFRLRLGDYRVLFTLIMSISFRGSQSALPTIPFCLPLLLTPRDFYFKASRFTTPAPS